MDEFATWMNCGVGKFCNMGEFVIWANFITYSAAPARGLCPYNARKRTYAMPVMFFCVFTHIFTRIYMIFANVRITHA